MPCKTQPDAPLAHQSIATPEGALPVTFARGPRAGAAIVVMPSAFGVAPDLEAQLAELAAGASLVASFDPFFRGDAGVVAYDDMRRVMARLGDLDRERAYRDLLAVIAWARRADGIEHVLVLGICFGGPFALRAAADRAVDGAITWHGTRMEDHLARAAEIRCPLRLHFGASDPFVPPAAVEAVRRAFAGARDVQIAVHDGATHGFSHRAVPAAYHEPAERAAMAAVRELLERCRA